MSYLKSIFTAFSNDSQRVSANLGQLYAAWLNVRRQLGAMPLSMYWAAKDSADYLHVKTLSLRVPSLPDRQAEILRKLDIEELLGNDLLFVGTNARKPYQAVRSDGYEVELLAAPSTHPLPTNEAFDPMASLIEQEWLLKGTAVSAVVATVKGRAAPLVVHDPRWMEMHKLWLTDKPERRADKKEKDRRQGTVLLDAARYFLQASHPLNIDFVLELPKELRLHFDQWCADAGFIPQP